jgi:hypothetical protein
VNVKGDFFTSVLDTVLRELGYLFSFALTSIVYIVTTCRCCKIILEIGSSKVKKRSFQFIMVVNIEFIAM